jgi:hypothetical protein
MPDRHAGLAGKGRFDTQYIGAHIGEQHSGHGHRAYTCHFDSTYSIERTRHDFLLGYRIGPKPESAPAGTMQTTLRSAARRA